MHQATKPIAAGLRVQDKSHLDALSIRRFSYLASVFFAVLLVRVRSSDFVIPSLFESSQHCILAARVQSLVISSLYRLSGKPSPWGIV
jgi:hypothetical protein